MENTEKVKLGISACLLGQSVRYNGGHQLDHFLNKTLGKYVDYVPVCPEVECGFGVPREAFRLIGEPDHPRLITINTKRDFTERMEAWARKRVGEIERQGLCGFIFKGGSPSSGMERVKVYDSKGMPAKIGVGIFPPHFYGTFPLDPRRRRWTAPRSRPTGKLMSGYSPCGGWPTSVRRETRFAPSLISKRTTSSSLCLTARNISRRWDGLITTPRS